MAAVRAGLGAHSHSPAARTVEGRARGSKQGVRVGAGLFPGRGCWECWERPGRSPRSSSRA